MLFDAAVDNLSVEEFNGILSSEYDKEFRDEYGVTMFELCDPCGVDYGVVLRHGIKETLEKEYRTLASYPNRARQLRQSAPYFDKMR